LAEFEGRSRVENGVCHAAQFEVTSHASRLKRHPDDAFLFMTHYWIGYRCFGLEQAFTLGEARIVLLRGRIKGDNLQRSN
jgi:hypothetical protein|tara:strand:- start:1102 stop:1341 length:240 start_codon:yes stop_codon:yes gene_type:complete